MNVGLPLILAVAGFAAAPPAAAEWRDGPWARHQVDGGSRGADGVRLADVNRDGLPDVVTGWEEGGVVRVCLHPGTNAVRHPWPAVTVGTAPSVEDAVFADLDGDGRLDVISASEGGDRTLRVHWGPVDRHALLQDSAWSSDVLPSSRDRMMWMFTLPLQVDGRHGPDLVAGGKGQGAFLGWWEAPRRARALAEWQWHPLRPVGWIMSIEAADMDADGDPDLVFSDRRGPRSGCYWLENPGSKADLSAPWREHAIGTVGREAMFLTLADLDRDGRLDVVAAIRPREVAVFRRLDSGGDHWAEESLPLPVFAGDAKAVAVGDLDLDGANDLVVTCENARAPRSGVFWMARGPNGGWSAHDLSGLEGVKYDLVRLLDLDGDGDLDVLTCEEAANLGVVWYENPLQ